jgi:alginate O-acetyltransferase complex protein AlgI
VLFSEPTFFVFFAVYLVLHFIVPPRARIYLIIAGSTVFYAWWRVSYVWLPYALTLIAWAGTLWLGATKSEAGRKQRLIVTIAALFAPLVVVKYAYFLVHDVVGPLLGDPAFLHDVSFLKFALPLGISFVTFTLTAYVVDVYREIFPTERNLIKMLGYVLFFPHLIAGPILRPNELLPQLGQLRRAIDARFTLGVALFAIGLVKKLVFADTIAAAVDHLYQQNATVSGWDYLLALHGFAMQIYCDFSGYTDMAIGLAYILRIRLPGNFRSPYAASSIVEFWRRWHMTLSFWLRDYLYIPLGGNRHGRPRQMLNIIITMLLGGLWHGAAWTFVIWGFLHGVAVAGVHALRWLRIEVPRWLAILLTFYFVTIAWVLFRAPDLATAQRVLAGPFRAPWSGPMDFVGSHVFELVLLGVFFAAHRFDRHALVRIGVNRVSKAIVWPIIVLLFVVALTVSQASSAKFIYFDF